MTPAMRITSVDCDREQYRDLLLLADEQWDMVELYLHRGEMFAAYAEDEPRTKADSALVPHRAFGCMIVTDEGVDERGLRIAEVKSLAGRSGASTQRCWPVSPGIRRSTCDPRVRYIAGRCRRQPSDRSLLRGVWLHAFACVAELLH